MTQESPRLPLGIRWLLLGLVVTGLLTALGVYHVWNEDRVRALGRDLSVETLRNQELMERQRKLRLKLSSRKQANDIRREAMEQFRMKIPERNDFIVVTH